MKLVAIVRPPERSDEAARVLANALGLALAEARMSLAPERGAASPPEGKGAHCDDRLLRLGGRLLSLFFGGESRAQTSTTAATCTSTSLGVLAEVRQSLALSRVCSPEGRCGKSWFVDKGFSR